MKKKAMPVRQEENAAQRPEAAPVCCPIHVKHLPDLPARDLGYIPLPEDKSPEELLLAFQAAPQFAQVPVARLFRERRGRLLVILLSDSIYYAQQAALYLTAMSRTEREQQGQDGDDFWAGTGLMKLLDEQEGSPLQNALTLVSARLLDASLEEGAKGRAALAIQSGRCERFRLAKLDTGAILISAPSGPVLTPGVVEQLQERMEQDDPTAPTDLFIALRQDQLDLELVEELRFSHGFHICRIGQPDQDYLRRFLSQTIRELLDPFDTNSALAAQVDLDQVIAQARRCRGERFCETDLEKLALWVIQRQKDGPLTTQDLIFTPFQSQKSAWKELSGLVGLDEVKRSLRRLLAAAALEDRRRQRGQVVEPMCRNMAFSGPPGTGKSVTARLAAQILREEGRGSGRFVEAGREQLIGSYLGQTSPMIAELFERARGGVLFIDEAGALLDGGQDIYAAEAVNALVRHMELEPETTVIFATYPGEMERLLASNPGLSSRVAQVLDFHGYDDEALWAIFRRFAAREGYELPDGAREVCDGFFARLRRRKGGGFGNGREARRLFQGAVEEMALRVVEQDSPETLALPDLEQAAQRLLNLPETEARPIGF